MQPREPTNYQSAPRSGENTRGPCPRTERHWAANLHCDLERTSPQTKPRRPEFFLFPGGETVSGFFSALWGEMKFAFSPGGSNKKTGGPAEKTRQGFGFLFSRRNLRHVAIQILFSLRGR